MDLTPQDLLTLRNLALRFIHDTYEVLSSAAHRKKNEGKTKIPPPMQPPTPAPTPPQPMPYSLSIKQASEYSGTLTNDDLQADEFKPVASPKDRWQAADQIAGPGRLPQTSLDV